MKNITKTDKQLIISKYNDFILSADFPCIMAQTVFKTDQVQIELCDELGSAKSARKIVEHLKGYLKQYDFSTNNFETFIAVFPNEDRMSEERFEERLWKQLQQIHEIDDREWDAEVSKNPEEASFSFSIAGKAFYIVGMHPNSSRKARQSPYPTVVFNLHWQFEKLRDMGSYDLIKKKIRKKDKLLQGNTNPMLNDFGEKSEARQYSGRIVNNSWKCPFHHK